MSSPHGCLGFWGLSGQAPSEVSLQGSSKDALWAKHHLDQLIQREIRCRWQGTIGFWALGGFTANDCVPFRGPLSGVHHFQKHPFWMGNDGNSSRFYSNGKVCVGVTTSFVPETVERSTPFRGSVLGTAPKSNAGVSLFHFLS